MAFIQCNGTSLRYRTSTALHITSAEAAAGFSPLNLILLAYGAGNGSTTAR